MHSSGSITRKFGPSWKQSTGQTSTQSVYLHFMQASVTTKVIGYSAGGACIVPSAIGGHQFAVPPVDRAEMQAFHAVAAVFQVAAQRELDAEKSDLRPRDFRLGVQLRLETFGPDAELRMAGIEPRAKHDVNLVGAQHAHDREQRADLHV